MFKTRSKRRKKVKVETVQASISFTELYAVFEKETERFLGVGNFTSEEIGTLQNKYVFSKM